MGGHKCWLEVVEPSATNLASFSLRNLWGVVWRGGLWNLLQDSHRVIGLVTVEKCIVILS